MASSKSFIDELFEKIFFNLHALVYVPNWLINSDSKTILDVACGKGLPMKLINKRHSLESTGVDLFEPYIKYCKKNNIHDKYYLKDVRKIYFKNNSFDTVIALQIIEHLTKKDALKLISKLEKIAKKQVIISTPIGKTDYETDDGNSLQRHKSYFYPKDFEKMGYRVFKVGGKNFFKEGGTCDQLTDYPFLRKLVFVLNLLLTPYYLLFQDNADYYFYAEKKIS